MVLHEPDFVVVGGSFKFNCTVEDSSEPVQSFNWYHNDSLIDTQQGFRVKIKSHDQWPWSKTLEVSSAVREDGGEYYCEAVFADTNETSNRHIVQIKGDGTTEV